MMNFIYRAVIFSVVLGGAAGGALAVSPKLNAITPSGGQRGTEMELRFNGLRLEDTKEIVFHTPGLELVKMDSPKTNALKATIRIARDCRLGEHQLRLRTATGVSELRTFYVGPYASVLETEPNDAAKPQVVPMNSTVAGVIASEDTDCFSVFARKGERISAEVEGIRLGRSVFDPFLSIRDASGHVLAKADDTSLLMQDGYLSLVAPKDGSYVIELRETSYGGNDNFQYRLHLGNFPRPAAVYPAGGRAGETVTVTFIGDPTGDLHQEVKLSATPQEKFGVFAESGAAIAPSPNWMRVSAFPHFREAEPNDTRETAGEARDVPVVFNGIIEKPGDHDWFRFRAKKGVSLQVNVFARRLRSPLDSVIQVVNAKGSSLADNDDAAGPDSVVTLKSEEDGEYAVLVRDHLKRGGPDYVYCVEVAPVSPSLTVKIPEVARNDTQTRQYITVPRGNRFATMVSVKRANFSGDLAFKMDGLPTGVALQADTMSGKVDAMPLVFEAKPDAPVTGKSLDLVAALVGEGPGVTGKFHNDLELVQGPNNTTYYGTRVEKLYVAVTEAAPFKLRIAEPKVPLVQAGTMDLKIIAERNPGFDEPISVKMMWNPPGVGSLSDVTIPKGQNSALYRLNATAEAQTRLWKIAVLGSATVGGGPLFVSTQLAPLEIAPPFLTAKIATSAVEPGKTTNVTVALTQNIPFEGKVTIRLVGLPEKATVAEQKISKDDKEVVFKVSVDPACPTGSHKALFCVVDIIKAGEIIPHSVGSGGILRIVPPKKPVAGGPVETKVAAKTATKSK